METAILLKFTFAFIFVVSLMLTLAWFLKRIGMGGTITPLGAKRRLKIVEFLPLDHRRRLVLVRRDDREHLLVLGPDGETVVESGISVSVQNIVEVPSGGEQKNA
jgi:flagellar protein FliO/FliZ